MAGRSAPTPTKTPRSPSWPSRGARPITSSKNSRKELFNMTAPLSTRMDRREAIKWMLTAAASVAFLPREGRAADAATPSGKGYGTDPDLLKEYKSGDLWPLTLTEAQRTT